MIKFEYVLTLRRRIKGTQHRGQGVCLWLIQNETTIEELVSLLNKKIPGAPMPSLKELEMRL